MSVPFEVLVVDDEPGDVELVRQALGNGRFACNIAVARNGNEALAFLRPQLSSDGFRARPDLILLDINMPQMNGHEFLRSMKSDPDLAPIPVVVVTTSDGERDIAAVYDRGASGFLTKPMEVAQLYKSIHDIEEYWFSVVRIPRKVQ